MEHDTETIEGRIKIMKEIKVTFADGHIINYKGESTDDDQLWEMITEYKYKDGYELPNGDFNPGIKGDIS